jgi:hypothetical protein
MRRWRKRKQPVNIDKIYTSKWLRAADVDELMGDSAQAVVSVDRVVMEEVGQDGQEKPIVYFKGIDPGLVLNKTNAGTIAQLYGKDTDAWLGKQIALFTTEVDFQGKQVLSIRVRLKQPKVSRAVQLSDADDIFPQEAPF